jgi:hypothetical protein
LLEGTEETLVKPQNNRCPGRDSNQAYRKTGQKPYHFNQLSLFENYSSSKYLIIQFLPHIKDLVSVTNISPSLSFREII